MTAEDECVCEPDCCLDDGNGKVDGPNYCKVCATIDPELPCPNESE